MLKTAIKISLAVIAIAVAYLLTANWLIYYRLGAADLKATDNQHRYDFNDQATASPELIYAALGDSLTSGVGTNNYQHSYPYLIAQQLAGSDIQVLHYNYSFPGARTQDIIDSLLDKAIADQPDVVTLLIGTNDIHGQVSLAKFQQNYETILARLSTETTAKINIISIPFIGTDSLLWPPYNRYYRFRVNKFNAIIKDLATARSLNYIDLAGLTSQYAVHSSPYYSSDNFHPSNLGYQYWSQIIYDHLNK